MLNLTAAWFEARWADAKNRAGRRYTPDLNINLPIDEYFEAVRQDETFFKRFTDFAIKLQKRTPLRHDWLKKIATEEKARLLKESVDLALAGLKILANLRTKAPMTLPVGTVATAARDAEGLIESLLNEIRPEESGQGSQSGPSDDRSRVEILREVSYQLREVLDVVESPIATASNNPSLLVLGSAGTGKTHLLCEMTRRAVQRGLPALLFLAQGFRSPFGNALEVLTNSIAPGVAPDELLVALDAYARARSVRCLISIDAINEGDRQSWTQGLPDLVDTVRRYEGVALVVSCRTPLFYLFGVSDVETTITMKGTHENWRVRSK